jgi:dihydroxyacetone kinase
MIAKKGRATYVGERSLNHPDAGAAAIAIIMKELLK